MKKVLTVLTAATLLFSSHLALAGNSLTVQEMQTREQALIQTHKKDFVATAGVLKELAPLIQNAEQDEDTDTKMLAVLERLDSKVEEVIAGFTTEEKEFLAQKAEMEKYVGKIPADTSMDVYLVSFVSFAALKELPQEEATMVSAFFQMLGFMGSMMGGMIEE